ncbi:MAG: hypothetical protein WA667_01560 [Candidatus Nitrosopolaris sp.]
MFYHLVSSPDAKSYDINYYSSHQYLSSLAKRWKENREKETEREQGEREREGYTTFLP